MKKATRKTAVRKNALREIKGSVSRFLSIFGIVAVGVGFFSGVKAAAPDMKATADKFFDDNSLMDLRVVSTYGFNDNDIAALSAVEGARLYPTYYTDVLVSCEGRSPATARLFALGEHLDSVNNITLTSGRMPKKPNECLVNSTKMRGGPTVGSTVVFSDGNGEQPDDMLSVFEYEIVGSYGTPMYIDKTARGSTSIGNGTIESAYLIPEENFCVEYYTEVYLRFPELDSLNCYSDEYKDRIDELTDIVEDIADARSEGRYKEILDEAEEKISDGEKELADAEKEADEKISDGEKEIADAKQQLSDAQQTISDAEKEISDGEQKLEDGRKELEDGKKELADKEAEYDEKIADAEHKLLDAQQKIDDAKTEIADNEKKLEDGEKEYNDGLKEYEDGYNKYRDGLKEYEDGIAEYNDGLQKYNDGAAELADAEEKYNSGMEEFSANEAALAEAKEKLDEAAGQIAMLKAAFGESDPRCAAALAQYNAGKAEYDMGRAALEAARPELEAAKAQIDEGKAQLSESRAELDKAEKELADAEKELSDAKAELDDAKKQLDDAKTELEDGRRQLEDGKKKLADGEKELEDGKRELEEQKAEAEEKFADARRDIADAEQKLEDGEKELADAKQKLEDGKKDYEQGVKDVEKGEKELEDGKKEADEKIADAKEELADARKKLDDLSKPKWHIFTRDDNPGYGEYGENSERINNIASVFPVFFVLVAVLVCLTTMTRMVEEQRVQIGTFKALGYSNKTMIYKYMLYALTATVTGAAAGVLIGMNLFPYVIINAYGMMYDLPELVMNIDIPVAAAAILVFVAANALTVYFTCRSALKEQAAQLMRPKAPKMGKRILLERITPVWRLFGFSSKVTARNLFRYKRKMLMTVIGVSGCTALLLTGFALYDSINDIVAKQYGELQHYDGIVAYDYEGYPEAAGEAEAILSKYGESVRVYQKRMTVDAGGKKVEAYIAAPSDPEKFTEFLTVRDRVSGELLDFSDGKIYIDEKLSLLLGSNIGAGSTLRLSSSDTESYSVTINGVFENYPNHYVYMTPSTYKQTFGEAPEYNTLYFTHNLGEEGEDALAEEVLLTDGILAITFNSSTMTTFTDMLVPLNFVIVVIILSAGLLAFIVVYNLTNINITERIREIATLKVLGFYDGEVDSYIFRENIILSILGAGAGLILGVFLANFVITTAEVDIVMFGRNIYPPSFIWAAVITVAFSVLVSVFMHGRLKNINMIEALKSIE